MPPLPQSPAVPHRISCLTQSMVHSHGLIKARLDEFARRAGCSINIILVDECQLQVSKLVQRASGNQEQGFHPILWSRSKHDLDFERFVQDIQIAS